tara:strand:- start:721 stop:1092 length:372 start_codon:yes stop_codon:yes gene_type:complete
MAGVIGSSADARSKTIGQNYRVRAWVNFNGTGSVSIRKSGNVSSITDHATGQHTVHFTNSLPDSDYAMAGVCGNDGDSATVHAVMFGENSGRSHTSCRFTTMRAAASTATLADELVVNLAFFR